MKMNKARMRSMAYLLPLMVIPLLVATPAHAVPCPGPGALWSQCPDVANGLVFPSDGATPQVVADDFFLSGPQVTAVRWWGAFEGNSSARPTSFWIAIWDNKIGASPSQVLQSYTVPFGDTGEQLEGVQSGLDIFSYEVELPTAFDTAGALDKFWISIQALGGSGWLWLTSVDQLSIPPYYGLDVAESFQAAGPLGVGSQWGGSAMSPEVDMAFELAATAVPEPGPLLLLAAGLVSAGLWGRSTLKRS